MSLLRFEGITKRFERLVANDHIDLALEEGEIHALIGENGAGKSTLMKILFGLLTPDEGQIFWQGERVRFRSPHEAVRQGIGMVQQHLSLAEQLTVFENVIAGAEPHRRGWVRREAVEQLNALMTQLDCVLPPLARVEDLPVAQRQLVEILRLLWRNVRLVILDEPTSLLGPVEIQALFRMFTTLKRRGITVIFITHRLKEVLAVADRISVLRKGWRVATLERAQADEVILARLMFGERPPHEAALIEAPPSGEVVLRAEHLEGGTVHDLSFALHRGEILAVVALPGNGGEELAAMLGGTVPWRQGRLTFAGQTFQRLSARQARGLGLGYLPEDRMGEAVVLSFPVVENVGLGRIQAFCRRFLRLKRIDWSALRRRGEHLKQRFAIKVERWRQPTSVLSGGNIQRLILAREFDAGAKVLVLAHPTQGIDVAGARQIKSWLVEALQDQSLEAALILTSDLEEVAGVAHRLLVLYRGQIQGEFDGLHLDRTARERLGLLLTGQQPQDATGGAR